MGNGLSKARFLTVQEVADLMRVSSMTVYRLIKSGDLPAVRVGRSFRVAEGDVDTYLAFFVKIWNKLFRKSMNKTVRESVTV